MTVRKLWFAASLALSATLVEAQGIRRPPAPSLPVDESAPSVLVATEEEAAKWIADLASGDFRTRERALKRLRLADRSVIAGLASRIAQAEELETIVRGTSLLGEFARSRDRTTRLHARDALLQLSKSRNSSIAQRAHAILNPVDYSNVTMRVRNRGPVNVAPAAAWIQPVARPNPPAAPVQRRPPPKPGAELERLQRAYDDARKLAAQDIVPSAEMAPVIRHLERELVRQLEQDAKGRNAPGF